MILFHVFVLSLFVFCVENKTLMDISQDYNGTDHGVNGKTMNSTCFETKECIGKLVCLAGECQCCGQHIWNGNDCIIRKTVTSTCRTSQECYGKLVCIKGNCQCSEQLYWDGTNCIIKRRSRSKLETAVAQELQALRQEIAKCQCGNGNGGHTQTINQSSLTNDTKALEEEIIHLKRDKALLQTQVASLIQNNTVLKDKVILLDRSLHTMKNTQCDISIRNETSHLEKALQITDNKLNVVINDANSRKQDFIVLLQQFIGLNQNHTTLKNKVMLLERTISTMAYSRNQSFIGLSEKVAGLLQNHTVLKGNVIQLERTFTMENTKCRNETSHLERALQITNNKLITAKIEANSRNHSFIALSEKVAGLMQNGTVLKNNVIQLERNFTMENTKWRNQTSYLERALQITNNKVNALTNDANARRHDFIALFQKIQSTEQRLENRTRSLEASQNMTFLKLQTEIINGAKLAEQNLSDRTKLLEMRENSTSLKLQQQTVLLQQELTKMSNRAALKTCFVSESDTNGVINFTDVRIADGIHNTDSIRNSGIFTCENSGLYLISVYIVTNATVGRYNVLKNTVPIASGSSSLTDYYETTSVTVIEHLTVNDKISVTSNMYIYGSYFSCLTMLQIK